jgi:mono/diheme cytochrome c family protein
MRRNLFSITERIAGALRCGAGAGFALATVLSAAEGKKVTYEDDVLPIFRDNCLKCHNPDKQKGDLDLSSFSAALKGGGGGVDLNSGDPEGSPLYKSVTHADDPTMPPNAKLADRDILVIRQWIEGGLLRGAGSKAIAASKPAADLALKSSGAAKPDGPPPMPGKLALEPVRRAERGAALGAVAGSPWAPVVAMAGAHQVVVCTTEPLDFAGVLAFPEGQICDLKFSRNGKLLVAGGGQGANRVWLSLGISPRASG